MVVLLLAAWAVILLPSTGVARRLKPSPADGVRRFERYLGVLGSTRMQQVPGRWVVVPGDMAAPNRRRARVIKRRRQTFVRLIAAAISTLILGIVPHLHALLILHVAVDAAVVGYVSRLRRWRRSEMRRARAARVAEPAVDDRVVPHLDPIDYTDVDAEEHVRIVLPEDELDLAIRRSG
ncbi:MAG: hypothetical protein ABR552_07755 [Actinomycetota bacterium]